MGKVPQEFLEKVVFNNLGARRSSVLVRPGHGLDNAVVSLGQGKVLLATTDPLSVIPSVGIEESAWLSVHLLASDLASSGVGPQFAMLDLNLPPEMELPAVRRYVKAIGQECKSLGIAIAGGHTGRYPGSGYTVVGGGMMFSVAGRGDYVTPAMARAGDSVVLTKGPAIGATAILAHSFPATVAERAGTGHLRKAKARLSQCSTVRDATVAASAGLRVRVTSMHDATEGGVLGGLLELSSACGLPVVVARDAIEVPPDVEALCACFGLDPLTTTSEGTLIVTCRPGALEDVMRALRRDGIEGFEVGHVGTRDEGRGLFVSSRGSKPRRHTPARDRYWEAYASAQRAGLG